MRSTVILREDLLDEARRLTGIARKTDLIHAGLESLIRREAGKRLIALGGAFPKAAAAPRRRTAPRKAKG